MRVRFSILAAFAAVLCMGLAGVASASAHEFESNVEGAAILSEGGLQLFKTKAGLVECASVTDKGTAKEKAVTQLVTATYAKCNGFGVKVVIKTEGGTAGAAGPVDYVFNANGLVTVNKTILIEAPTAEGGAAVCHVEVPTQTLNGVTYTNTPAGDITETNNVREITSTGLGGTDASCTYATEKEGRYELSSSITMSLTATLKWV